MPCRVRQLIVFSVFSSSGFLAGCAPEGLPAQATVTTIDHKCEIIESVTRDIDDPRGSGAKIQAQELHTSTGECKSVEEWADVRSKRTKNVNGTAAVHVDYQAPQDGSYHSATLIFTGSDDEFYELKAGDRIAIMVAKADPAKIRKA